MAKIVFFCIPAHGHTNPTLGVVKELVSRGHEVWYYSYDPFAKQIRDAGAHFVSCDEYDRQQNLSREDAERLVKDLRFSMKILADTTLALDGRLCEDMARIQPDCIVADSMAIWGKGIAKKLGIPFVISNTTFAFNRYSARVMQQSFGDTLKMLLTMPGANREIKRLRGAGYPFKNVMDIMQGDDNAETIVYTSAVFQPSSETFSEHFSFVGPSIRPITQVPETDGKPLIYISLGTVLNDAAGFYRTCMEAVKEMPWQVILSVGDQVSLSSLGKIPENCQVFPSVDQIGVLSKAAVFLSHCGMNSVSESLYYGVPLVTFPRTTEQLGVARRTEELQAGLRLTGETPEEIRMALKTVLDDPSYREHALAIAESFRSCSGTAGAADKIQAVCR